MKLLRCCVKEEDEGGILPGLNLCPSQIDFFQLCCQKGLRQISFLILELSEGLFKGNEGLDELEKMADIFLAEGYSEKYFHLIPRLFESWVIILVLYMK